MQMAAEVFKKAEIRFRPRQGPPPQRGRLGQGCSSRLGPFLLSGYSRLSASGAIPRDRIVIGAGVIDLVRLIGSTAANSIIIRSLTASVRSLRARSFLIFIPCDGDC